MTRHNHSRTGNWSPTYYTWASMIQRCTNPARNNFHLYGGAGIKVTARWFSFVNFLADMGERPPNTSLDRIRPGGSYSKENCRWASSAVQNRNKNNNKLSAMDAERIRDQRRCGYSSHRIGKMFKISKTLVLAIEHGRAWK